jgi:hypothetical protein
MRKKSNKGEEKVAKEKLESKEQKEGIQNFKSEKAP